MLVRHRSAWPQAKCNVMSNRIIAVPESPPSSGTEARLRLDLDTKVRIAILAVVIFCSGTGALIFETLWLRLSGLTFGNSVWAAALILSSFMAGLALGNAIAGSAKVRRWRPLILYGVLEVAVAFLGCTIVFGLPLLGEWLRPVFQTLWGHHTVLIELRFVLSFLILILPTTAMGLTLPILVEDPILRTSSFSRAIGLLYGCNTLGAVAGAVVGEGFLIEALGLWGTGLAAGFFNCTAAVAAFLVAKSGGRIPSPPVPETVPLTATAKMPWRLLFVSLGTGAVLLCLEVVWFRFMRLYVASSATAFAVMLAVVLAGIGLGALTWSALKRRDRPPARPLPILLLLAAVAVLVCYLFFPGAAVQTKVGPFNLDTWKTIGLLSLALMFPVSFLSGIVFPCLIAAVQARVPDRMNSTGIATLFNTLGATVGPLLASFVLLPSIGYQWSLISCAVAYVLLAVLVSERQSWSLRRFSGVTMILLCVGVIVILAVFPYQRDEVHFTHAGLPYETDAQGRLLTQVVKRVEGTSDTIQLVRRDLFGRPFYYRLLTNAYSMSATTPGSQRYMRLFAYLPLAFHPQSEDALLICYGCGVTADALVRNRRLRHIDVVDISKEVLSLADYYIGINYPNPLRDPRVTTFVQDGRFFLQASPRQYDVITSEPPPPKVAGSVNLYTTEFFSLMHSRLKEGGIASFWLPIYQLRVEETKAILRAFHDAFGNALVWTNSDEDWIMMGIKGAGRRVKEEEIRGLWNDVSTGVDLKRAGIEDPRQLGALFIMDGDEIDRITQGVKPLTDRFPKRLTDAHWDEQATQQFAAEYMKAASAHHRFLFSPLIEQIWPDTLNRSIESFFIVREARYLSGIIGSNKLAELDLYLRHSRLRAPVLEVLDSNEYRLSLAQEAAREAAAPPPETLPDLVAGALARRDIGGAVKLLEREQAEGGGSVNRLFLLIYLYCVNGNVEQAETLAIANAASIPKDWFVDWLWKKLQTDFGFHPPL